MASTNFSGPVTSTNGFIGQLQPSSTSTAITNIAVYTPSINPASVAAATCAEQTFTVAGLTTADKVIVNGPANVASTGIGIVNARVSAADTLALTFVNPTAGALDAAAGTYSVIAIRS